MKPVEVRLVGRFRLTSKVQGQHEHLLYKAVHTQTDASLFLKGEEIKSKPPANFLTILQEGKILQTMQGGLGIPHMYWCGQEEDYNFIVLEELESDLNGLLRKCGGAFSRKSALMMGMEVVEILQYYHFKNFIHNNVNPGHLMVGAGEKFGKLFIVDFSNSIRYRDAQTLEHIVEKDDKKAEIRNINMLFSSPRYHRGLTPSRKDDMISVLYLLLFLEKGSLPWSKLYTAKKSEGEKSREILKAKETMSAEEIFEDCTSLISLYNYTKNLAFDEKPRYSYYQNVLRERLQKEGEIDDKIYDWYLLEDSDEEDDLDIDFKVIPNEEDFIQQLSQEIQAREGGDAIKNYNNPKQNSSEAERLPKKSAKEKQCLIY